MNGEHADKARVRRSCAIASSLRPGVELARTVLRRSFADCPFHIADACSEVRVLLAEPLVLVAQGGNLGRLGCAAARAAAAPGNLHQHLQLPIARNEGVSLLCKLVAALLGLHKLSRQLDHVVLQQARKLSSCGPVDG